MILNVGQWPVQVPKLKVPKKKKGLCKAYVGGYTPKFYGFLWLTMPPV